jgi:hypothetical protein
MVDLEACRHLNPGSDRVSKDDYQAPSNAASDKLLLGLARTFGRKRLCYSQGQLATSDQATEACQRLLVFEICGHTHLLNFDSTLRFALPGSDRGKRSTVFDRRQDRRSDNRGIDNAIDPTRNHSPNALRGVVATRDEDACAHLLYKGLIPGTGHGDDT